MASLLAWLLPLSFYTLCALSGTATIDDELGDSRTGVKPVYTPADKWWLNTNCLTCTDSLVVDNLFAQTWHDGLQAVQGTPVSLSLSFTGTGISVMCAAIDLGPRTDIVTPMDLAFTLDGQPHGTYLYPQTGKAVYVYNVTVFSVSGLPQADHTVTLTTNNANTGSRMFFDWAQYTFDDLPAASSILSASPTTAVAVSTQVTTSTATAMSTAVINTSPSTGSTDTVLQTTTSISTVSPQSPSSVIITSGSITSHGSQSTPSSSTSSSTSSATVSSALLPTAASTNTSPEVSPPATGTRRKNNTMIAVVLAVSISVVVLAATIFYIRYRRGRARRTSTEDQERTPVPYAAVPLHSAGSLQSLLSPNRLGSNTASAGGTFPSSAPGSTADIDSVSMLDPPPTYAERISSHVVVASPALRDRGALFEMRKTG